MAGDAPGELEIGPLGGTRMMCPDEAMRVEDRYLRDLGGVVRFGFLAGRLALGWRAGDATGTLLFEAREPGS